MSRLHNAAGGGDIEAVRDCIAAGMDVNALGFRSFTPLQRAASGGFPKVVRELLKAGADPHFAAKSSPPLTSAASGGHLAVVKILVEAGAEINATQGKYPAVNMAAMFGRTDVLDYMREQSASFDIPDDQGKTATDWLAIGGIEGQHKQLFGHVDFTTARPDSENHVRKMMAEFTAPEEYVAKNGRYVYVCGYGALMFEDKSVEQWAHRLCEILQDSALLAECEKRYLTGEELEEARKVRARQEKSDVRRKAKEAIKAARMQDDEE